MSKLVTLKLYMEHKHQLVKVDLVLTTSYTDSHLINNNLSACISLLDLFSILCI